MVGAPEIEVLEVAPPARVGTSTLALVALRVGNVTYRGVKIVRLRGGALIASPRCLSTEGPQGAVYTPFWVWLRRCSHQG